MRLMTFRERLVATLRAVRPILEVDGVLVAGSEVPNLLERGAASTLVISQDVDIAVPIAAHAMVKQRLSAIEGLSPSAEEPSVWVPSDSTRIEVNFIGYDPTENDPRSVRIFEDDRLPLLVFGPLSFLRLGREIDLEGGLRVPLPRNAGLLLEKLVTDRSGVKGDRDLLVVLALLLVSAEADIEELENEYRRLPNDIRHAVLSNLTMLSLLEPIAGMPDPTAERARVAALLSRLERAS
jgi:hypothetical protein